MEAAANTTNSVSSTTNFSVAEGCFVSAVVLEPHAINPKLLIHASNNDTILFMYRSPFSFKKIYSKRGFTRFVTYI
jgi:hypothetical protein